MSRRLKQIISESGYLGLIKRLKTRVIREQNMMLHSIRDAFLGTYKTYEQNSILNRLLNVDDLEPLRHVSHIPVEVINHYLNHRFDLLGSGWVKIFYGMHCHGLEQYRFEMGHQIEIDRHGHWLKGRINQSNLLRAQKIWSTVDPAYKPIDWQLDFKSGYRWSEKTWSKKIKFGHKLGVDVKVPWELARMQHLPQLALSCFHNKLDSKQIKNEFQNQVLDFIATNPPGYGVNWVCPMDIAIRAANCLLARDLFLASGATFPVSFEKILAQSMYEHGLYVVENLEWNSLRANHYLANITGLAYIAAYLPSNEEIDTWLAFAVQELIIEVDRQFYNDGGNFEGSTAYHRLSTEMVYYATALIVGLPKERLEKLKTYNHLLFKNKKGTPRLNPAPMSFHPFVKDKTSPFSKHYFQRLEKMAEFIIAITKPNNHISQIGDNDSGRFFKLAPEYQKISVKQAKETYANLSQYDGLLDDEYYFFEEQLNCTHIVYAGFGLFQRSDFADWLNSRNVSPVQVDAIMIRVIAGDLIPTSLSDKAPKEEKYVGNEEDFHSHIISLANASSPQIQKTEFSIEEGDLLEGLNRYIFPDFGLYIMKSKRLYLLIRCWLGHQQQPSSHRHHDQLTVELTIDGVDLIRDPGTYLYTPIPSERFMYRNSCSHFSPFGQSESKDNSYEHVFGFIRLEKVHLSYYGVKGFFAETIDHPQNKQLAIYLGNTFVLIYHSNNSEKSNGSTIKKEPSFSNGYGIKLR